LAGSGIGVAIYMKRKLIPTAIKITPIATRIESFLRFVMLPCFLYTILVFLRQSRSRLSFTDCGYMLNSGNGITIIFCMGSPVFSELLQCKLNLALISLPFYAIPKVFSSFIQDDFYAGN
jgi:hypothetical protein